MNGLTAVLLRWIYNFSTTSVMKSQSPKGKENYLAGLELRGLNLILSHCKGC